VRLKYRPDSVLNKDIARHHKNGYPARPANAGHHVWRTLPRNNFARYVFERLYFLLASKSNCCVTFYIENRNGARADLCCTKQRLEERLVQQ
jgi:hypothetical protein